MFLSRITVPSGSFDAQKLASDLYGLHCAVMSGFPIPNRILFRAEPGRIFGDQSILVQSQLAPKWRPEKFPVNSIFELRPYKPTLASGRPLAFRLLANPVVRDPKNPRKKWGISGESKQMVWLRDREAMSGFKVERCIVSGEKVVKAKGKDDNLMTFLSVLFEGALTVTNPSMLADVMETGRGLGSGKSFGFGLLSLAR